MTTSSTLNSLRQYASLIEPTDRLPDQCSPVLLGLFGEVGSIMATVKKVHREGFAYVGFREAAEEEFGDVLWYLFALCRRLSVDGAALLARATKTGDGDRPVSELVERRDAALFQLGIATAALFDIGRGNPAASEQLAAFVEAYVNAIEVTGLDLRIVAQSNSEKAVGRFVVPEPSSLPTFDDDFEEEERLPPHFEIDVTQRRSGQTYLRLNGVFIGDPLTDNIIAPDGYRFHDVFHFAHAAVLHWSPTFRSLIKHKRKSRPSIDEAEDGGRAIVVEEGLTAWIFSRAKALGYFADQDALSFDILKTVRQFVRGYEVEACPLSLWERAILDGYAVFRQVRANSGGTIIGDRVHRTIAYRPLRG